MLCTSLCKQALPGLGLQSVGLYLNGERFTASTPRQLVEAFLSWAATQPLVRWIDERETFRKFNNVAVKGVQSARGLSTPIWARGLKGEGQVIGVADTVRSRWIGKTTLHFSPCS